MRSTILIIEIAAIALGLSFILYDVLLRRRLKRKDTLIQPEDENKVFVGYILKITGLALFAFAACFLGRTLWDMPRLVFIFTGVLVGIISGCGNVMFWMLSEDKYKVKPALGEPIGGTCLGCLGFVAALVIGTGLGFALYFIVR